eukprot:662895-Lingulodinium_polyedra.AAC.1
MTNKRSQAVLETLVNVRESAEARRLRQWVYEQTKDEALLQVAVAALEAKIKGRTDSKLRPFIHS